MDGSSILCESSFWKYYYRIEKVMKLRKARVLQTGASNFRCTTAQSSTRSGWTQGTLLKTLTADTQTNACPKRTQSTSGIRKPQIDFADQWIQSEKRLNGKSEKDIVVGRERLYKDDIQNTKLVHFSNNAPVPEQKLQDIKQLIQRKYANRKKFFNIFSEWDQESKGELSSQNVHFMLNSMGIKVRESEADAFVKEFSSNKEKLNLNDFLGVIFSPKSINVFSKSTKKFELPVQKPPYNENRVMQLIKTKEANFVKLVSEQTGNITLDKWKRILERAGITTIKEYEAERLFENYRNQNVIDDKGLVEKVTQFDLEINDVEEELPKKLDSKAQLLMNYKRNLKQRQDTRDLYRSNIQTMISSQLQQTIANAEIFKSKIRKYFSHKNNFQSQLGKILNVSGYKNRITYDEVKKSFANLMRSVSEKFKRRQLQSFLNTFAYNREDEIQISDLTKVIYEETPLNLFQRVDHRPRCLPPQQCRLKTTQKFNDGKQISNLLKKVENGLFSGRTKSYELFKKLDRTHDGYLSLSDFSYAMKNMNILEKDQSEKVFRWINENQFSQSSKYLKYTEFARIFSAGMSTVDKNHAYTDFRPKQSQGLSEKPTNFDPRSVTYNQKKTRFSGNPPNFNNYISINTESNWGKTGDLNQNIRFQKEQEIKKRQSLQSRIKWIRGQEEAMAERIKQKERKVQQREQHNLQRKAEQLWAYNHVNHLKNEWN